MLAGSLCVPGAPFSLTELFQTDPFGSGWSIAPACPDDSRAAVSENGVVVSETVEDAKGVKRPLIDLTGESDEDEAPKRARPREEDAGAPAPAPPQPRPAAADAPTHFLLSPVASTPAGDDVEGSDLGEGDPSVSVDADPPPGRLPERDGTGAVYAARDDVIGRRWTSGEDASLRLAIGTTDSPAWNLIANALFAGPNGRTSADCRRRWETVLSKGLVKGAFTEEEDKIIIECMREGGLRWMQIAERIPGRIGKQCRERWTNHLDPNLKKGGWTREEDAILVEAQQRFGNAWTKIAELLPGRAESAVKNRWNSAFYRRNNLSAAPPRAPAPPAPPPAVRPAAPPLPAAPTPAPASVARPPGHDRREWPIGAYYGWRPLPRPATCQANGGRKFQSNPQRPCEARKIGSCGRWLFFVSISAASNRTGVSSDIIRRLLDGTQPAKWWTWDWEFRNPLTYG